MNRFVIVCVLVIVATPSWRLLAQDASAPLQGVGSSTAPNTTANR
jgi:hypothetical protein